MKKNLMAILLIMISLVFLNAPADAYTGIWDEVPGKDIVIPFFCEIDGTGLNTVWSVASLVAQNTHFWVYDVWSDKVYDDTEEFTENDIEADDCLSLVSHMSIDDKTQLTVGDEYQGYIVYSSDIGNTLMGWSYMMNTLLGFSAAGMVFEVENGSNIFLCEYNTATGQNDCISAQRMYPRYYIHNNNSESETDWIFLVGEFYTTLSGLICNTDEDCPSGIDITLKELTKVNIKNMIPGGLFTNYPYSGFAILDVSGVGANWASILGISHQKAQAQTVEGTWDVTHEIHRNPDYTISWGGP